MPSILNDTTSADRASNTLNLSAYTDEQFVLQIQRTAYGDAKNLTGVDILAKVYEGTARVDASDNIHQISVDLSQEPTEWSVGASNPERGLFQLLVPLYEGTPPELGATTIPVRVAFIVHQDANRVDTKSMRVVCVTRTNSQEGYDTASTPCLLYTSPSPRDS